MSIGPEGKGVPIRELHEAYKRTNLGLLDILNTVQPLPESRWPRTVRGWLSLLRDSFITDVLRRCHTRGCWKRRVFTNIFGIGMCSEHFSEWYSE